MALLAPSRPPVPTSRSAAYAERSEPELQLFDRAAFDLLERFDTRIGGRLRRLKRFAEDVLAHEHTVTAMDDAAIRARAAILRGQLRRDLGLGPALAETFALVRETSGRVIGQRHYPVQVMGAAAMTCGMLAEMATGEGKTLTASLAAVAGALAGFPVHVITVNDYLAERDALHLAPVYAAFGLSTGICRHGQPPDERRAAYACDITYASNKEVAFDYLRDRLALGRRRTRADVAVDRLKPESTGPALLLRGLGFAIVDEADSVLVDEARTPLIIAAAGADPDAAVFRPALDLARTLREGEHYRLGIRHRKAVLLEGGIAAVEAAGLPRAGPLAMLAGRREMVQQALAALHLFHRDEHYVVRAGKVEIVDENTGRIAEGRSWDNGLHQMVEAKEGVDLTAPNVTQARITYQRYFQRYQRLAGMTGTASELAGEMRAVYGLNVVRIPLHRPSQRRDLGLAILPSQHAKWAAVADAIAHVAMTGRPVLVGTRAVSASEALSQVLTARGLAHVVLNARQDADEAAIVAAAGGRGRITVATNMAGRGTDIRLEDGVAALGGLHVIATELHESPRVDRQLAGRGGRQGDPATLEVFAAFDDALFATFAPREAGLCRRWAGGAALTGRAAVWLARLAQHRAARQHDRIRRLTLKQDRQLSRSLAFAGVED